MKWKFYSCSFISAAVLSQTALNFASNKGQMQTNYIIGGCHHWSFQVQGQGPKKTRFFCGSCHLFWFPFHFLPIKESWADNFFMSPHWGIPGNYHHPKCSPTITNWSTIKKEKKRRNDHTETQKQIWEKERPSGPKKQTDFWLSPILEIFTRIIRKS